MDMFASHNPGYRDPSKWAQINEIFSSVQGEGVYCGVRQLFVRFSQCNLTCCYCDARDAWSISKTCRVEKKPGTMAFQEEQNPISIEKFLGIIDRFQDYPHHTIALTGGEPLMHAQFLANALPQLRAMGHLIYLETNGTLPSHLASIFDYVDIIAMDIKPPSVARAGDLWTEHEEFLRIAAQKRVFVKLVASEDLDLTELKYACQIIASVSPRIPLVIQPMNHPDAKLHVNTPRFITFQDLALRTLQDVRLIPQCHKILGGIL
jgi:organic radical activating enzyme